MSLRLPDGLATVGDVSEQEKPLQTTSFVVHATRGVIRDQKARRRAMFLVLMLALGLLVIGSTVLQAPLSPREHPFGFLLFWIICGWLTLTALLLAVFDLLLIRRESRQARRRLQQEFKPHPTDSRVD